MVDMEEDINPEAPLPSLHQTTATELLEAGTSCSFTYSSGGKLTTCINQATKMFVQSVPVCNEHLWELHVQHPLVRPSVIESVHKHYPWDQFPGLCYIALLPDGFIKIGYSTTHDHFKKRMQGLSRDYGAPVIPLALLNGGPFREAVLHKKLQHLRARVPGEKFSHGPEIAELLRTENSEGNNLLNSLLV